MNKHIFPTIEMRRILDQLKKGNIKEYGDYRSTNTLVLMGRLYRHKL